MHIRLGKTSEFAEKVKGKRKIFCFGAGKDFRDFLEEYSCYEFEKKIEYVVDNSPEKQGKRIPCGSREIAVISPEEMLQVISENDVILISTLRFPEIIRQLNPFEKLGNTDCYICYFLRMNQNDFDRDHVAFPGDFFTESEICIPKTIHYCWFGGGEIPRQNRIWMESWRRYCPDYQIVEWNEKNYDVSKNLYIRQAYEKKKWAFVSDYARVDIISEYGGVYLDTDVELLKNIDDLLKNKAFCGFESRRYVAFGLGFGAVKRHPIIERLRKDYEKRRFILEDGRLDETTCPIYQTELLVQYGLKRNGEFQKLDGITVYPERVLCGMSPLSLKMTKRTEDTYSVHHFAGSWLDKTEQDLKNRVMQSISRWEET